MEPTTKPIEEPRVITEISPNRVVCPACGASQGPPRKGRKPLCLICSAPLSVSDILPAGPTKPVEGPAARPLLGEAKKALADEGLKIFSCGELDDVLRSERRVTSILAFVPFWGLWQLSRSTVHTAPNKMLLSLASIGLSLALVCGLWHALPDAQSRAAARHDLVAHNLQKLSELVRDYAHEHRTFPDAAAWQRSADGGDLRFFDPWGRLFRYRATDGGVEIGTYGADDQPGGHGEDADVFITVGDTVPASADPAS